MLQINSASGLLRPQVMLAWHRSAVFAHHHGDAPDLRYVTAGECPEDLGGWCFCQGPWLGQPLQYPPAQCLCFTGCPEPTRSFVQLWKQQCVLASEGFEGGCW